MNFITKEEIRKGWSGDKKYRVTDKEGNIYLLRESDTSELERKKAEFEMMRRVADLGIPMCLPIEFGVYEDSVYSVQSWIFGKDAEDALCNMSNREKYAYGIRAGDILKRIHSIPAPKRTEDWETRFNRKMDRKIRLYNECLLKYENGDLFIDFINKNRHLLKGRPQVYQHGDYHIGNLMIGDDGELYVIDFNRNDFGDPWEEFNRIVWCAQKDPYFASGRVDGYFGEKAPLEFWNLLALYISSNALSSLYWAIPFGEGEVEVMRQQAKEILEWYDNMKSPIPSWYIKGGI